MRNFFPKLLLINDRDSDVFGIFCFCFHFKAAIFSETPMEANKVFKKGLSATAGGIAKDLSSCEETSIFILGSVR